MRLVNAQRQLRERGRIRIGYSTPGERGNKVPHRLDTFRFTTPDEQTIFELAAVYGGVPEPWPEGTTDKWQLVTTVDTINVILPAGMALNQCFEQYRKGFCTVRCDGETCTTPGADKLVSQPCACDPNNRDCSLTTMINVILADLLGLGTFRLVTHSWYGAMELAAAVDMIESAMAIGHRVPCRLFLTQREVRRLENGRPKVKKFPVPVLDLNMSVAALGSGSGGAGAALASPPPHAPGGLPPESAAPALPSSWRPVDQAALPEAPAPDVRSVLADNDRPVRQRANAAPPIPSTGVKPRTEQEHASSSSTCSFCGQPYGTAKLVKNPEPGGSKFVHSHCLPEEGDQPPDQPPVADETARGEGGAAGTGEASSGAQPAPAAGPQGYVRMMNHAQQRKCMALAAEVWPATEGATSGETDDMRRENLLWLCAVLGQPGLKSRTEINAATAPILLDALEEMKAGTLVLTAAGLVDAETGEVKVAAP